MFPLLPHRSLCTVTYDRRLSTDFPGHPYNFITPGKLVRVQLGEQSSSRSGPVFTGPFLLVPDWLSEKTRVPPNV